jgi:hypothetical protein
MMANRSDRGPPNLRVDMDFKSDRKFRRGSADSIGASRI